MMNYFSNTGYNDIYNTASSHNRLGVQLDQQRQQSYDGYIQHAHVRGNESQCPGQEFTVGHTGGWQVGQDEYGYDQQY